MKKTHHAVHLPHVPEHTEKASFNHLFTVPLTQDLSALRVEAPNAQGHNLFLSAVEGAPELPQEVHDAVAAGMGEKFASFSVNNHGAPLTTDIVVTDE